MAAFHFRASGTNLTRQAPVAFVGAFVLATNVSAGTNVVVGGEARSEPMQVPVFVDGQWRVEGTAIIGGTNAIQIRAEPER